MNTNTKVKKKTQAMSFTLEYGCIGEMEFSFSLRILPLEREIMEGRVVSLLIYLTSIHWVYTLGKVFLGR